MRSDTRTPLGQFTVHSVQSPQRIAACSAGSSWNLSRGQRELAIAIGIRKDAQCVGDLQALLAGAFALAAQATVERPNLLQMLGQQFFVAGRQGVSHGLHVFVQLIHVGHAGNGGADTRLVDDPFERGKQGSIAVQLVIDGVRWV